MATVNEGSTSYHPIVITDASGEIVTPEALRYKLSDSLSTSLVDWTVISAETTLIEIQSSLNIIAQGGKKRFLTIEATHDGGKKITSEIEYELIDLKGL